MGPGKGGVDGQCPRVQASTPQGAGAVGARVHRGLLRVSLCQCRPSVSCRKGRQVCSPRVYLVFREGLILLIGGEQPIRGSGVGGWVGRGLHPVCKDVTAPWVTSRPFPMARECLCQQVRGWGFWGKRGRAIWHPWEAPTEASGAPGTGEDTVPALVTHCGSDTSTSTHPKLWLTTFVTKSVCYRDSCFCIFEAVFPKSL